MKQEKMLLQKQLINIFLRFSIKQLYKIQVNYWFQNQLTIVILIIEVNLKLVFLAQSNNLK